MASEETTSGGYCGVGGHRGCRDTFVAASPMRLVVHEGLISIIVRRPIAAP